MPKHIMTIKEDLTQNIIMVMHMLNLTHLLKLVKHISY